MKHVFIRLVALPVVAALSLAPLAQATSAANLTVVNNAVAYLESQQGADGHIGLSAGDTGWSAVALAAAGKDLSTVKTSGGTDLRAYLAANPPTLADKAADWERSIIAITADSQNPYNFGGKDYISNLRAYASAGQLGLTAGSNDDYFGLIALLAARVDETDPLVVSELAYILSQQRSDGGFSYAVPSTSSDTNDTAAAIMALAASQQAGLGSAAVTTALNKALAYVLASQNADGGFPYDPLTPPEWGGPVSDGSSTSWVLMALTSVDEGDSADGTAAQAYLRTLPLADGSFPSWQPAVGDVMSTAPAVTALADGTYPLSVYDGALPEVDPATPSPSPSPSQGASVRASVSPSPSPTGQVLGASAAPSPTPSGQVQGASVLPQVGAAGGIATLLLVLVITAATAFAIRAGRKA